MWAEVRAAAAALLLLAGCSPDERGSTGIEAGSDRTATVPEPPAPPLPRPDLHPGMPGLLNDAERRELDAARQRGLEAIRDLPEFGFGEPASPKRIAAWDMDIGPEGEGLPPGRGSAERGRTLYRLQCVQCHGATGEGSRFEALAGRVPADAFPFAEDRRWPITVGSYWPYATTLFDYIRRAMPQAAPGTLPADDVYALTAYILELNGLLGRGDSLDAETLPRIVMPARDRFVRDDRRGGPEVR